MKPDSTTIPCCYRALAQKDIELSEILLDVRDDNKLCVATLLAL